MRKRMTEAARLDSLARKENRPAMHKLKMLPEVISLLNRNQYVNNLVDPEINLLEGVKFFLEPLEDGSLPAYNIQRDLFAALARLPIHKDALIASGIGKVVVFYTKSKRPEIGIKRQAERLLAEWTRPILQRSDDYSKRVYEEVEFDPTCVSIFLSLFHSSLENATLTCIFIANWPPETRHCQPKTPQRKPARENYFHPDWPTALVLRVCTQRTLLFHAPRLFRRTSLHVRWVPVEKIASGE